MTPLARPDQVRAIQIARRPAGLADDGLYRTALAGFGVQSCKALTVEQASTFLDRLKGASTPGERPSKDRATGLFASKLQALWLAAWNLGIVREKHDTAMIAFVKRQAKIEHTRFLRDPIEAASAIEGLKKWIAREAKLTWPSKGGPGAIALKRTVVNAQYARLGELGHYPAGWASFDRLLPAELDRLSNRLGRDLRDVLGRAG